MQGTEWGQDDRRESGMYCSLSFTAVIGWKRAWVSGGNLEGESKAKGDLGNFTEP